MTAIGYGLLGIAVLAIGGIILSMQEKFPEQTVEFEGVPIKLKSADGKIWSWSWVDPARTVTADGHASNEAIALAAAKAAVLTWKSGA